MALDHCEFQELPPIEATIEPVGPMRAKKSVAPDYYQNLPEKPSLYD